MPPPWAACIGISGEKVLGRAKVLSGEWRSEHNQIRHHGARGYQPSPPELSQILTLRPCRIACITLAAYRRRSCVFQDVFAAAATAGQPAADSRVMLVTVSPQHRLARDHVVLSPPLRSPLSRRSVE
jgi:hypothetical protein